MWYVLCNLVVIVANANATLGRQAVSPPTTNVNVGLGNAAVAEEQPKTEDRLSKNVKDRICHDFAVDSDLAGTVGKAPNTRIG